MPDIHKDIHTMTPEEREAEIARQNALTQQYTELLDKKLQQAAEALDELEGAIEKEERDSRIADD